jgi:hypothetical protein
VPKRLTGLAAVAAAMPENGGSGCLDWHLRKLLDGLPPLLAQHNSDSRRAHPGWPDWVIAGPGGVIVRELKRQHLGPTPLQQRWLDYLAGAGLDVAVWRPLDLLEGRIAATLRVVAGLRPVDNRSGLRRAGGTGLPNHAIMVSPTKITDRMEGAFPRNDKGPGFGACHKTPSGLRARQPEAETVPSLSPRLKLR